MLVLGFDYGTKKIGVAVGQLKLATATALAPIKARDGIPDWIALSKIIAEWQPDHFVVGMPYNMDGSESEMCTRARKFARRLHGRYGLSWSEMDERLSTFEARSNLNHESSSESVDSRSACLILESWFRLQN